VKEKAKQPYGSTDEFQQAIEDMAFVRVAQHEYQIAASIAKKWIKCKDKMIGNTAQSVYEIQLAVIDNMDKRLKFLERLYSSKNTQNADLGKEMSKIGELDADTDIIHKKLIYCSIMVTHVLVDRKPDENNHLSYLNIDSEQRKNLIEDLDSVFGSSIKDGMQTGQSYLTASGAALRKFLTGDHESADKRKK